MWRNTSLQLTVRSQPEQPVEASINTLEMALHTFMLHSAVSITVTRCPRTLDVCFVFVEHLHNVVLAEGSVQSWTSSIIDLAKQAQWQLLQQVLEIWPPWAHDIWVAVSTNHIGVVCRCYKGSWRRNATTCWTSAVVCNRHRRLWCSWKLERTQTDFVSAHPSVPHETHALQAWHSLATVQSASCIDLNG